MAWWGSGASGVHREWPGGGQGTVGSTGNGLVGVRGQWGPQGMAWWGSGASGVHREWPGWSTRRHLLAVAMYIYTIKLPPNLDEFLE